MLGITRIITLHPEKAGLSPVSFTFLFALVIRTSDQVTGIKRSTKTHKMSLYADNIILFMIDL